VKRWRVGRGGKKMRILGRVIPDWVAEAAVTGAASATVAAVIATSVVKNMGTVIRADIQKVRDRL
jgi:hypothetical protein